MLKIVWRVKKGRTTWKSISSSDKTHQNLPKYQRVKNNASKRHDSTQTPCKLNSVLNVARRLSIIWAPFSNCSFKLHCRLNILRVFYCRIRWIRMHVRIKYINHWNEKEHSLFAFGFKTAGVIFKRNKCKSSCVLHTEGINIGEKNPSSILCEHKEALKTEMHSLAFAICFHETKGREKENDYRSKNWIEMT